MGDVNLGYRYLSAYAHQHHSTDTDEEEELTSKIRFTSPTRPYSTPSTYASRPIEIEVGSVHKASFFVHESLLCEESDMFNTMLRGAGDWKEKREGKVSLKDEDPELIGCFVDYLYRDHWTGIGIGHEAGIVRLARLYCLGERLMAKRLQNIVLVNLITVLKINGIRFAENRDKKISAEDICSLLEIVFTKIPEKSMREDPLREHVVRFSASRLLDLQRHPRFRDELTRDIPEISRSICLCTMPYMGIVYP